MRAEDMSEGLRVRTVRTIEIFPDDLIPIGTTGTVCQVTPGMPIHAHVKLDERRPALDEWNNELQVWHEDTELMSDSTPNAFEVVND